MTLGGDTDRPARVVLPASYDDAAKQGKAYPVLMVLHGWGSSGAWLFVCACVFGRGLGGRVVD